MLLLMLFALIAGAGTAITPCVLPVLPALLSASALGGRRRPLGIVTGLAATFTIAIVALAQLVKGVGLASGATRTIAVIVLLAFGVVLLIPNLAARVQAPLSRLGRFGPKTRGSGFWSGVGVGGALGFVCAPCAGPILAAVTSVSASGGASAKVVAVAIAYTVGLSAVLLLYALGGRVVIDRIRRSARGHIVERSLGAVLLLTGVVMATNLDVRFEEALAKDASLPAFLVDPTRSLENSHAVQSRLASLRPASRFAAAQNAALAAVRRTTASGPASGLPDLGQAPEFTDNQRWFNTPGGRPITLAGLNASRHVVLVDFWTYTCINCIRTLPFLKGLYAAYHPYGLEIVGVHSPEFAFEQQASNVAQAVRSDGLRYPVAQDNNLGTWNAYQNQYWPAEYLIDVRGEVRHTQFGEGDYKQTEAAIRALLLEAGATGLPAPITATAEVPSADLATPETYVGTARSERFVPPVARGVHDYPGARNLPLSYFALRGRWNETPEYGTAVATGAAIEVRFQSAKVYLVLSSAGGVARRGRVLLDGRPISSTAQGADVRAGMLTVGRQRLYGLVALPAAAQHLLTVQLPPGVSAYAFTFG
jgi:cytochrome c biogenesis protein CcdA/thiol-disulfide isomerase/thioredoxin